MVYIYVCTRIIIYSLYILCHATALNGLDFSGHRYSIILGINRIEYLLYSGIYLRIAFTMMGVPTVYAYIITKFYCVQAGIYPS